MSTAVCKGITATQPRFASRSALSASPSVDAPRTPWPRNYIETRDALRVIVRVAIREATLHAKGAPPVEDVTVIGDMTIDRLRHTITVAGEVRSVKPCEFALIETLARRLSFVFSRPMLLDFARSNPEGIATSAPSTSTSDACARNSDPP